MIFHKRSDTAIYYLISFVTTRNYETNNKKRTSELCGLNERMARNQLYHHRTG